MTRNGSYDKAEMFRITYLYGFTGMGLFLGVGGAFLIVSSAILIILESVMESNTPLLSSSSDSALFLRIPTGSFWMSCCTFWTRTSLPAWNEKWQSSLDVALANVTILFLICVEGKWSFPLPKNWKCNLWSVRCGCSIHLKLYVPPFLLCYYYYSCYW